MIDALNVHNIPEHTPTSTLLASYVDYIGANPEPFIELQKLFPHHRLVSIATHGADAQMCDVESGAMEAQDVPLWTMRQRRRGIEPWCYATESNWVNVVSWCAIRGVRAPLWWAANWSGGQDIPAGAVGRQYASTNLYDSNVLLDLIPGFDPDPAHNPSSDDGELEDDMPTSLLPVVLVSAEDGGAEVLLRWPDGSYEIVRSGGTAHAFTAAGSPTVAIPVADIKTRQAAARL